MAMHGHQSTTHGLQHGSPLPLTISETLITHLSKYWLEISLLCVSRLAWFETKPLSVHDGEALRGLHDEWKKQNQGMKGEADGKGNAKIIFSALYTECHQPLWLSLLSGLPIMQISCQSAVCPSIEPSHLPIEHLTPVW